MARRRDKIDSVLRYIVDRIKQCAHPKVTGITGTNVDMPDMQGSAQHRPDLPAEFDALIRVQLSRQMCTFIVKSVPYAVFSAHFHTATAKNAGIVIHGQFIPVERNRASWTSIDAFSAIPTFVVIHLDTPAKTGRYR